MIDELYADVVGQQRALAVLRSAAARPVHAYLFIGPPGTGKRVAAASFAAALLCPSGGQHLPGAGLCDVCRRAVAGVHPDVVSVEREGPYISMDAAREVVRMAATSALEGGRKVIVLHDFHLVRDTGPALLKSIEEPPPSTVFVILAEHLPPELRTIASRCGQVPFGPLSPAQVIDALVADGVDRARAAELAAAAGGRLDRARLLAEDTQFETRRQAWHSVPARLDGTGATIMALADELVGLLESSVEPLRSRHAAEMAALTERNERAAEVVSTGRAGGRARAARSALNSGVREMEERQRREVRRQRTDELRAGLATLAGAYRERLVAAPDNRRRSAAIEAVQKVDRTARSLEFNPQELLAVQGLLARLAGTGG